MQELGVPLSHQSILVLRNKDRAEKVSESHCAVVMPGGLAHVGMLRKQCAASGVSRRIKVRAPTQWGSSQKACQLLPQPMAAEYPPIPHEETVQEGGN